MSETDPILFRPRPAGRTGPSPAGPTLAGYPSQNPDIGNTARFNRQEIAAILDLYGRKVAAGAWRDYAIDHLRDVAVFSVFRRACEVPIYRIVKDPRLTRRQGAYSVIATGGLIMKRGHDLVRVLKVLEDQPSLISV